MDEEAWSPQKGKGSKVAPDQKAINKFTGQFMDLNDGPDSPDKNYFSPETKGRSEEGNPGQTETDTKPTHGEEILTEYENLINDPNYISKNGIKVVPK
jgi:hypothetical protein